MPTPQLPLYALISEGIAEVECQQVSECQYPIPAMPLLASSILLQDSSVWKCTAAFGRLFIHEIFKLTIAAI
jgi:hypothetical protein